MRDYSPGMSLQPVFRPREASSGLSVVPSTAEASVPVPNEDEELREAITRAKHGDTEAFGLIYDRYQPEILRYLTHHVREYATAEDLTQLVFLKAWRAMPRFQERGVPLRAWLYRIAHNQMVDHFRTNKVAVGLDRVEQGEPAEGEATVLAEEARIELDAALRKLSPAHREVLVLRYLMEKPVAEISQIMDRKEVTIRGLQLRALRALRRELSMMEVRR